MCAVIRHPILPKAEVSESPVLPRFGVRTGVHSKYGAHGCSGEQIAHSAAVLGYVDAIFSVR